MPPGLDPQLLAQWTLDEISSEDLVATATVALATDNGSPDIVALATLDPRPLRHDVAEALASAGTRLPTRAEAIKQIVDRLAADIATSMLKPGEGATRLARWSSEIGHQAPPLIVFVGLASELDVVTDPWRTTESPERLQARRAYEEQTVAAARQLTAIGGIPLPRV